MSSSIREISLGWPMAAVCAGVLLAAGAVAGGLMVRPSSSTPGSDPAPPTQPAEAPAEHATHEVSVRLTPELVRRAGIEVAPVEVSDTDARLRLPGTVQPNGYRQVAVTPLVDGRITGVSAELGDLVTTGESMASIYSPGLADAQTAFLASRAELAAHDQRLRRTIRLEEIGAASQQELEQVHAEHTTMTARVAASRSMLELLGLSAAAIDRLSSTADVTSVVDVPAPLTGVVTERSANVGANVDPSMTLFTVVDLSSVWVVADLYERDFSALRVGGPATITVDAFPGFSFEGRVSYLDPQVKPDTRTAGLRIEVPNADGRLRLGMYASVSLPAGPQRRAVVMVPADAVQPVGERYVVYVPGPEADTFIEREVRIARRSGDAVEIDSGLEPGDRVVTRGAFFVRAERERTAATGHTAH